MVKRLISLILIFAVVVGVTCIAPAAFAAYVYNPAPSSGTAFLDAFCTMIGSVLGADTSRETWDFTFTAHGLVSDQELDHQKENYNSRVSGLLRFLYSKSSNSVLSKAVKAYDSENHIWRLADSLTGKWIVDSMGRFPYYESIVAGGGESLKELSPDTNPAPEINQLHGNQWITEAKAMTELLNANPAYGYDELSAHADTLNAIERTGHWVYAVQKFNNGGYYGLVKIAANSTSGKLWLADKHGYPYLTTKDKYQLAINQKVNHIVQDNNGNAVVIQGENVKTEKPIIDQSKMELNIPVSNDNSVNIGEYINQQIIDMSYNFDDHSYTVNTYDVTYNNDNRQYTTNYYTWNITYNITNTYVTYIGSNDAYQQKEYEFYYELPDGRSSADLSADEVAAMSFQFADCVNYHRSATDTNLRALFHFDGDLSDAGYFSDKTAFTWQSGASITYMDSAVFNGALYLDETAHQFDIQLPTNIWASEDFTIQWRYYQASQPDTQTNIENSVALGDTVLFRWDERSLYPASGSTQICALPVGNWVELALVRHNGTISLYLNGLAVKSWTNSNAFSRKLTFAFGSTSRAYSMLDELRVLNFALVTDGVRYTPTAVPYDSNLVLTLPGEEAVVDSYWNITSTGNLLKESDFTTGDVDLVRPSEGYITSYSPHWVNDGSDPKYAAGYVCDGYVTVIGGSSPYYKNDCGFYYKLYSSVSSSGSGGGWASGLSKTANYNKKHIFSVMDDTGHVYSLSFTLGASAATQTATFDWGSLVCYRYAVSSSYYSGLQVVPNAGTSINLIYAELKLGETTDLHGEKVTNVFDPTTLKPNTAAVQTDIPIHGYTVGGVRPTFPTRGDVWFGVTNRRISSVQVYTGSAWTSVNARWWTGSRWIPIYAFDIFTLEDCWDIADGDDVITPIESDTAGWNWWKRAWTDFRAWLGGVFGGGGDTPGNSSGDGDSTQAPVPTPGTNPGDDYDDGEDDILDDPLTDEDGEKVSVFSLFKWIGKGLWKLVKGLFKTVLGGIVGLFKAIFKGVTGFFDAFDSGFLNLGLGVFSFKNYGGFDIWD